MKAAVKSFGVNSKQSGPSGKAGKQKDIGPIPFGSPFSSKVVVCGHCLACPSQLMKR